jgi:hypothetical protein
VSIGRSCLFLTIEKWAWNDYSDVLEPPRVGYCAIRDRVQLVGLWCHIDIRFPFNSDVHLNRITLAVSCFLSKLSSADRELLQGLFYQHMLQNGICMAQRGFIALNIMLTKEHTKKFRANCGSFLMSGSGTYIGNYPECRPFYNPFTLNHRRVPYSTQA